MAKPASPAPYLLLKCRAEHIPLRDSSVNLVIATPPYYGTGRISRKDCCTRDPRLYCALLARFLEEATRIVEPGGYILVHSQRLPVQRVRGIPRIVFHVLRKPLRRAHQASWWVGAEKFRTHFARVKGINWGALPIWLYGALIQRYSRPGARVVHAFSGTGNGALAALGLARSPILLDLHHHRQVRSRLNKLLRRQRWPAPGQAVSRGRTLPPPARPFA